MRTTMFERSYAAQRWAPESQAMPASPEKHVPVSSVPPLRRRVRHLPSAHSAAAADGVLHITDVMEVQTVFCQLAAATLFDGGVRDLHDATMHLDCGDALHADGAAILATELNVLTFGVVDLTGCRIRA